MHIHKAITMLSVAAIALILTGCDNETPMDRETPKVGAPADTVTVPPPQINGTGTDTGTGTDGTGSTQNPPPGQP